MSLSINRKIFDRVKTAVAEAGRINILSWAEGRDSVTAESVDEIRELLLLGDWCSFGEPACVREKSVNGLMNSPNQSRAVVMVGRSICHSNGIAQFEVRPTRARPFDRVAHDPRMAFMPEGYMWRLTFISIRIDYAPLEREVDC